MVYEIMPIVWMLRLMLMLPVTVLSNGNFRFRWLSVPVALSFATWLVLVVISYYTVRFRLDPVSVDGKHFHVWDLVPKYASSFTLIYIVFMPYTNWALTGSTIEMIERWKRVQRLGVAGLRQHRRIWVALVKVVYKLSEAWGRTQAVLLGIFFVTAVSICFVLTHMVLSKSLDKSALWIGPALLLVILAFVSICHSAQVMIDAIRVPAKMQLLLLSFLVKDEETTTEIVQFLEEMYLERPRVSVCGLGDLSKASIVYAFGLANTYIVVLSQFSISAEALRANFIAD
ncbi:uncharacterized protein LOC117641270 [Thrips palmi]|uniref:Uncharacterized protein LOC117641270 n=1 Tax=Thrips palmi TaxID=161013 RepID=A0A6P8YK63_THRPL|nr:uncharacterized protein LOC117641270 [Thrips palmi]